MCRMTPSLTAVARSLVFSNHIDDIRLLVRSWRDAEKDYLMFVSYGRKALFVALLATVLSAPASANEGQGSAPPTLPLILGIGY